MGTASCKIRGFGWNTLSAPPVSSADESISPAATTVLLRDQHCHFGDRRGAREVAGRSRDGRPPANAYSPHAWGARRLHETSKGSYNIRAPSRLRFSRCMFHPWRFRSAFRDLPTRRRVPGLRAPGRESVREARSKPFSWPPWRRIE